MPKQALILIALCVVSTALQYTLLEGVLEPMLVAMGLGCVAWLISLMIKDASIVDAFWGLFFIVSGLSVFFFSANTGNLANLVLMLMVVLWGVRLSLYIFLRGLGKAEDPRYQTWRKQGGRSFWWVSLFRIFILQSWMAWAIMAPVHQQLLYNKNGQLTVLAIVSATVWLFGFLYQSIADSQLYRFKSNPNNQGKLLRSGLWQYSRHPNYFAEVVMWWAVYFYTISYGSLWLIIGPLIVSYTLVKFTGAWLLDKMFAADKKTGFDEYQEQVPSLIPLWLFSREKK